VQEAVAASCKQLGLGYTTLYSAAGHDAQILASITESGMLFIPSRGGKSHRVDETSDAAAIERGASVLLRTLLDLAA
jgi:acetylornithine deacetylase/succinyl-diaminopimelate desuccinylase-like protein